MKLNKIALLVLAAALAVSLSGCSSLVQQMLGGGKKEQPAPTEPAPSNNGTTTTDPAPEPKPEPVAPTAKNITTGTLGADAITVGSMRMNPPAGWTEMTSGESYTYANMEVPGVVMVMMSQPLTMPEQVGIDAAFESFTQGVVGDGTLLGSEDVTVDGNQARIIEATMSNASTDDTKMKVLVVATPDYLIGVLMMADTANYDSQVHFFDEVASSMQK